MTRGQEGISSKIIQVIVHSAPTTLYVNLGELLQKCVEVAL